MGHIHTAIGDYDFTVGAYIIRNSPSGYQALLHLHKKLGKWLPFGGHIELDENPWQAVLREVEEEIGYTIRNLQIIQPVDTISEFTDISLLPQPLFLAAYDYDENHKHTDIAFAFIVESDPPGATLADESKEFAWFDLEALAKLPADKIFNNTVGVYQLSLIHI